MIVFGTKSTPSVINTGEFNCPNCQDKRNYTLKRYKKYFHIFYIPLIPMDNLGDSLECQKCSSSYVPGSILTRDEYSPENPVGNNNSANYLGIFPSAFGTRLGAYVLDLILIYLLIAAATFLTSGLLTIFIGFIYFVCCDFIFKGSSIGKLILKIKISEIKEDNLPTATNIIIRNVVKGICGLFPPIYLVALSNEKVQTLHDKISNTIVISK
jgi:hypothetical protein